MECYRCGSEELALAPLWPYERTTYGQINIVIRQCRSCGLEQNHCGYDEPCDPDKAAQAAPSVDYWDDKAVNPPARCEVCGTRYCSENH